MKYIAIDLETTGIDHERCQIIEFAAVVDDIKNLRPLEELPKFQTYVRHDFYHGEPYALAMHSRIFKRLAQVNQGIADDVTDANALMYNFQNFLVKSGYTYVEKIIAAGKNFAGFDKKFIDKLPNNAVKFHHRVLDPMMKFVDLEKDIEPPDSKTCLERAGFDGTVAHTALEDALMVVKLLRKGIYNA